MEDKQTQALKRLTKKLNALRKTLRADERNLLDRMILGDEAAAEVVAHRISPKQATKVSEVVAHKMAPKQADKVAEVVAHKMAPKQADKVAEVVAHRLAPKQADKVAEVVAHKMAPKADSATRPMISFDWATGNYTVVIEEPEVEGHLLKPAITPKIAPKVTPKVAP